MTKRHIKWRENRLRVRLAAQALSSSVGAALIHAKKKGFKKFQSSEGTANFCIQIDRMFDMLNCRTKYSAKNKYYIPVEDTKIEEFKVWVNDAKKYIEELEVLESDKRPKSKPSTLTLADSVIEEEEMEEEGLAAAEDRQDSGKKSILKHRRKTGFLGFYMGLINLIPLFLELKKHQLKFLLTYKLSQDHLETWFSAVRSKSGNNNNPTCEQFKSIFRRLLIHHELRTSEGSNCEGDDTKILSVSSYSKKNTPLGDNLFSLVYTDDVLNRMHLEDIEYNDVDGSLPTLNTFQTDVVSVIAGFLIKKLEQKKLCALREISLMKYGTNQSDLLALKNRGGLTIPSKLIEELCAEVEKQVRVHETELLNPRTTGSIEDTILEHIDNNGFTDRMDYHVAHLISLLYIRIKIRYLCKRLSTAEHNIRHSSKKQVIFAHQ